MRYNSLHFCIFNDGWGPAKNTKIFFRLIPLVDKQEPISDYTDPFPYSVLAGDIVEYINVDVSTFFDKEGVNFKGLSSLQNVKEVDNGGHRSLMVKNRDQSKKLFHMNNTKKNSILI